MGTTQILGRALYSLNGLKTTFLFFSRKLKSMGFSYQKAKEFYPGSDAQKIRRIQGGVKKNFLNSPLDTVLLFQDEFSLSNTATTKMYKNNSDSSAKLKGSTFVQN